MTREGGTARVAMPHFLEDCPEWSFELRGTRARGSRRWTIQGHSVAGERTGFMVKELRLGLDAGMNTNSRLRSILITHGHADHSHNVPTIAMGSVAREIGERPLLYMPRELVDPLDCMTRAYSRMNGCWSKVPETPHINIHGGCSGGDELEVACGKAGSAVVAVRVVDCVHSVPCVGYILSTVTNRLRPEWQGKPGKEIATARKAGTVVTERHTTVQLAFLGDTTCEVFELHPELLCVPVIMIECTGLDEQDSAKIAERKHVHFDALRPFVVAHPDITWVLMHFSLAKSRHEIIDYFAREAATATNGLANVVLWLDGGVVEVATIRDKGDTAPKRRPSDVERDSALQRPPATVSGGAGGSVEAGHAVA